MTAKRREKRINDRMRLDWIQAGHRRFREAINCRQSEDTIVETRVPPRMTLRQAIDAAIRAARRQRGQQK